MRWDKNNPSCLVIKQLFKMNHADSSVAVEVVCLSTTVHY